MGKFTFEETFIKDLFVITPTVFGDNRGYFLETYQKEEFAAAGITAEFVQDNESCSAKGVLRGLHFQKQNPQGKLVRVISGEVYDVAVDLRGDSETYGKWYGVRLSAENKKQFYVPERPHLWETASNITIAAAVAALREFTLPMRGILTKWSQLDMTTLLIPSPSLPIIRAMGLL